MYREKKTKMSFEIISIISHISTIKKIIIIFEISRENFCSSMKKKLIEREKENVFFFLLFSMDIKVIRKEKQLRTHMNKKK